MKFQELPPGQSVKKASIPCFRSEIRGGKFLYLMAGTHGDEVEGVYLLKQLFQWLKDVSEGDVPPLPLVVIPVLNVDGCRARTRVNAHGVDLNRNYPTSDWAPASEALQEKYHPGPYPLSEPENIFLNQLFDTYPPKIILTFHSWAPLLNYNGNCKDIADFLSRYNSYPVQDTIGYPTPGSLGIYAQQKYASPVLTFECPTLGTLGGKKALTLSDIWEENREGLMALFRTEQMHKSNQ